MKNEWILLMKNNRRLKLTIPQTLTHYGIVLFLLLIFLPLSWSLIEIYITDTYSGVRTAEELIQASLPFLLLAVFFAFIQYKRLNFKVINVTFTEKQFQEAVKRTVNDLEWQIIRNKNTFFRANRPWNWTGSWGEMITIIKDKDQLLINSICDPGSMSSAISYGWNRKNIRTFLKNLEDVLNNKAVEIKIKKTTNEWSPNRILIRLFAYPLCFFLITLGVYSFLHPLTIRTTIAGLGALITAGIYLYSDIKILATKKERK